MAEGSNKTLWIILGSVAAVLLLGCCTCGGVGYFIYYKGKTAVQDIADRNIRRNDMMKLGFDLLLYHDQKKQGPPNVDELQKVTGGGPALERVRKGEITVVWNFDAIPKQTGGSTNTIMAYESKAGSDGKRLVVYMDAVAVEVTEAEFQAKPKAKVKQ